MAAPDGNNWPIQAFESLISAGGVIFGIVVGALGMANRRGKMEGVAMERLESLEAAHKEHADFVREELSRIEARVNRVGEWFGEIKANMATRADIATLSTRIDNTFERLSGRSRE